MKCSSPRPVRQGIGRPIAAIAVTLAVWCSVFGWSHPQCASAQDSASRPVDPRRFGFDIPLGPMRRGNQRRVTTADEAGNPVVGLIHVEVGDYRIVMLPDGQLVARSSSDAPLTDRPFQAAEKDAVAERFLQDRLKGFRTKQTRRYVYLYNTSETFALATSRILETMFPGLTAYAQSQKIDVHEPQVPLVVIMFRTEQEYQQYRRMPEGVVAYYNLLSNEVVMYEESKLYKVKPQLAIQQSLATIAHEGAHQILYNIGVQQRLSVWPMWLGEGMAEFFAPTTTGERLRWKGAGQVNDFRMFELERYLKGKATDEADGQLIEQAVTAARLTSTGYAAAWSLTHFLAKTHRAEFGKLVNHLSHLGPLEGGENVVPPGIVPANLALFKEYFGDDLADMQRRLILHLKRLPYTDPFAEWPHYVAMVLVPNGRTPKKAANSFHSSQRAEKWVKQVIGQLPADRRGAARSSIRQFPNRVAADLFVRQWLGRR